MANEEIRTLIDTFKAYRDLLRPVEQNMNEFIETYDNMQANIERLNTAFSGDIKQNLEGIYKTLSEQAAKASDLASQINRFGDVTGKYVGEISKLILLMEKASQKISSVNELEEKASRQIARLDDLLEEKAKTYDIKQLEKTLDAYNKNVERVSEFINKDVAESMIDGRDKLDKMKQGLESVLKGRGEESENIEKLLEKFTSSAEMLKRIAEKQDVNEAYIFEILDRWADNRRVKTKR